MKTITISLGPFRLLQRKLEATQMVPNEYPSLQEAWTLDGVEMAIKRIVPKITHYLVPSLEISPNTRSFYFFEKMMSQGDLMNYKEDYPPHQQLLMYGFARNQNDTLVIDNRIFERRLYRYFISMCKYTDQMKDAAMEYISQFIKDRILNVPLI